MQILKMYTMHIDMEQCSILFNRKSMLKAKYVIIFLDQVGVHVYKHK